MKRLIPMVLASAAFAFALSLGATRVAAAAEVNPYRLAEAPQDASDVIALRSDAKGKQDVVVVGRIGGRQNPWIKGMAAFSLVDRSLKPCNEIEGDTCKTPWDYCCESDLGKATLLVTFVDESGKIIKQDARELLGVKELDTLTIVGKAKRDPSGNVTVLASKVYVPAPEDETTP
ncbi:MAG: hypothetical protein AB7G28_10885 [Pirellulales bacterium]